MTLPPRTRRPGFSFTLNREAELADKSVRTEHSPRRILIAADCSNRAARDFHEALGSRKRFRIDIDRLEPTLKALGATLAIDLPDAPGQSLTLTPSGIEDLHPDALLQVIRPLAELEATHRMSSSESSKGAVESSSSISGSASPESGGDTLTRLLGKSGTQPELNQTRTEPAALKGKASLDQLIRNVVAQTGSATPSASASGAALASAIEASLGHWLRTVLCDPNFRALETTWRSLDLLTRRCPDNDRVNYLLLDASTAELAADLPGLGRQLEESSSALLLVDHLFRPTVEDLGVLAGLLRTCAEHHVVLVTGAHSSLAGCSEFARHPDPRDWGTLPESVAPAWESVQHLLRDGAQLALVLPRFMLRQPYGKEGEPLADLAFEEILDLNDEAAFCWGNGAYLLVQALAEIDASGSSGARLDTPVEIRELPVVRWRGEEGVQIKPCAETWLSERALQSLQASGFSVLQAVRDTDRIRVHF